MRLARRLSHRNDSSANTGVIPIDILYLVDRLENLLNSSSLVPILNKRMITEDEFLDILDQMRIAIPEEIKAARRVTQEKDRTLAQAKEEADRIVALAKDQAAEMSSEHVLAKAAQQQADQLKQVAEADAHNIRAEADDYTAQVLSELQTRLDELATRIATLQGTVYNGLRVVNEKRGTGGGSPSPGGE